MEIIISNATKYSNKEKVVFFSREFNFANEGKKFFSREFTFANEGLIREIREIFFPRNFRTLK